MSAAPRDLEHAKHPNKRPLEDDEEELPSKRLNNRPVEHTNDTSRTATPTDEAHKEKKTEEEEETSNQGIKLCLVGSCICLVS